MAEGKGGSKILMATRKRAKRVQEKIRQKLGQSEQTKDEVFEEFVEHFSKQQLAASKLQKELIRYMHATRMLYQSTKGMRDILGELYEPSWEGFSSYKDIFEQKLLLWEDLITNLHSKMVEPMNQYMAKFPDVKGRIAKRERKVVDYDLTRRELETVKGKTKVSEQRIQQSEDAFLHAKQLYDEITDELYEELPTFYDSRIQFYASVFQSIATTEAKFHEETTKIDEQFSSFMDKLAEEAASGIHSTKKERGAEISPKPLSRPGDDSDEDSDSEPSTPVTPHIPTIPQGSEEPANDDMSNSTESPSITPASTPSHTPKRTPSSERQTPSKPPPFSGSLKRPPPSKPARSPGSVDGETATEDPPCKDEQPTAVDVKLGDESESESLGSVSPTVQEEKGKSKSPPPKPARIEDDEKETEELGSGEKETTVNGGNDVVHSPPPPPPMEVEADDEVRGTDMKDPLDDVLFKVVASHPYTGEDEDELTFEKGETISVIPYEDPDDEEEGWLFGRIESTGVKGIFPENFTKRLE